VTPMRTSRISIKSTLAVAAIAAGIVLVAAPAGACPPVGNTPTPTNQPQTQPPPPPQPPRINVRDHRVPNADPVVRDTGTAKVIDHRAQPKVIDHRDPERLTGSEYRKQRYMARGQNVVVTQAASRKKAPPPTLSPLPNGGR
jgi:hypothetical protein